MTRTWLLAFVFLSSFSVAFADSGPTEVHSRQEVVDYFKKIGFTGTAGVFDAQGEYTFGLGDENGQPILAENHILIGSVTKQFTVAAILRLAEQGRLSVTDPITKYVAVANAAGITLHHLLTHTSGLADVIETDAFATLKLTPFNGLDALVTEINRLTSHFAPGAKFEYSNTNFFLLSKVIEVASGESWWSYVKREIVDRAGMTDTNYLYDRGPALITGHLLDAQNAHVPIDAAEYHERGWASGAGGLESTVRDLARWNSALYGGRILNATSLQQMTTSHVQVNAKIGYGYGLFVGTDSNGETIYMHPGGIPGYVSQNSYYPEHGLSVITLANYEAIDEPRDFANALADIQLRGHANLPPLADNKCVKMSDKVSHVGLFSDGHRDARVPVWIVGDALYMQLEGQKRRLVAQAKDVFYDRASGAVLTFAGERMTLKAFGTTRNLRRSSRAHFIR